MSGSMIADKNQDCLARDQAKMIFNRLHSNLMLSQTNQKSFQQSWVQYILEQSARFVDKNSQAQPLEPPVYPDISKEKEDDFYNVFGNFRLSQMNTENVKKFDKLT